MRFHLKETLSKYERSFQRVFQLTFRIRVRYHLVTKDTAGSCAIKLDLVDNFPALLLGSRFY